MSSIPNSQNEYEGPSASHYDGLRTGDPKWEREQQIVAGYMKAIAGSESTVLDVPVGTGRFLPLYSEIGCSVIGVDVSEYMLAEAQHVRSKFQTLQLGDITQLDMQDASVDITVCVRFVNLVGLDTVRRALEEVARVTGGYVILGVRTRAKSAAVRRALRAVRNKLGGRIEKLTIHSVGELMRLLDLIGAQIVDQELVVKAKDGSSSYSIYLLRLDESTVL